MHLRYGTGKDFKPYQATDQVAVRDETKWNHRDRKALYKHCVLLPPRIKLFQISITYDYLKPWSFKIPLNRYHAPIYSGTCFCLYTTA